MVYECRLVHAIKSVNFNEKLTESTLTDSAPKGEGSWTAAAVLMSISVEGSTGAFELNAEQSMTRIITGQVGLKGAQSIADVLPFSLPPRHKRDNVS